MKHLLLLLLFCGICNAQQQYKDYTKVTAYRLVNSDDWGPCSIEYYAKTLKRTGHYIQAMESYNDTLAYNLLQLKQDAPAWAKDTCSCGEEPIGKALVRHMFVVEVNSHKDTLFTTTDNKAVFFPKEQMQYKVPENRIASAFTKDVSEFLHRNFASEIEAWKMDSIPAGAILLSKKPVYGLTRKEFEKNIAYFSTATTDSVFASNGKLYNTVKSHYIGDAKFSFNNEQGKVSEIVITNPAGAEPSARNTIFLDGVKVGDSEDVLCSKYDNSTLLKNWDAPLSAINNYYTYELYLDNDKGKVMYVVRNKVIQTIHVQFNYPKKTVKNSKVSK